MKAPLVMRKAGGPKSFHTDSSHFRNGNLDFGSNKEGLERLGQVIAAAMNGSFTFDNPDERPDPITAREQREQILAAYNEPVGAGTKWIELGASLGDALQETANRMGFMRTMLMAVPIEGGNAPRIPINSKQVAAVAASGPSQCIPAMVRGRWAYPSEFYVMAHPRVERRDIEQGPADILDRAFEDGLEQLMVVEDRTWRTMADRMVGLDNPLTTVVGGIGPTAIATMREMVSGNGIPPEKLLLASDCMIDITSNGSLWGNNWDPVTQLEIIKTGYIGRLYGLETRTDAVRLDKLRVLARGEFYVVGEAQYHGGYTDRGEPEVKPSDGANEGIPARGWFINNLIAMAITGKASVAKGVKG